MPIMSAEAIAARSLLKTHPALAADWHPDNDRTPNEVTAGSGYRAQWRCQTLVIWPDGTTRPCAHEWATKVAMRGTCGTGCPACGGKAAAEWNRLDLTYPHLAADWNDPRDITTIPNGSAYRAQWRCATCHHEWTKPVEKRARYGYGCPACSGNAVTSTNNLAVTHLELALDWHPDNPGTPADYTAGSNVRVRWRCRSVVALGAARGTCDHEWEQAIGIRTGGNGCPACAGYAVAWWNSVAAAFPDVARDWHDERNHSVPSGVVHGSRQKVWWQCATCQHEWFASVQNRTRHGRGCPACSGNVVTDRNRLSALRPDLLAEWHPDNDLGPDEVSASSDYRALWKCSLTALGDDGSEVRCDHEWRTRVANRARLNNDCPACRLANRSRDEIHLAHEIALFLPESLEDITIPKADGHGRPWAVDIALSRHRIVIEYDGAHHHRGRDAKDLAKTADLTASGWRVLRVREEPLGPVGEHWVTSRSAAYKATANAVLTYLRDHLEVDLPGLDTYLAEPALLNADAARADMRRRLAGQLLARERRRARMKQVPAPSVAA